MRFGRGGGKLEHNETIGMIECIVFLVFPQQEGATASEARRKVFVTKSMALAMEFIEVIVRHATSSIIDNSPISRWLPFVLHERS